MPLPDNVPLDIYVARDVSGSLNLSTYDRIQAEILGAARRDAHDTLYPWRFGADAIPVQAQMSAAQIAANDPPGMRGKTNFANLFKELDLAIGEERKSGKSAMPEDLINHLSRKDLRDLVEYLASLKEKKDKK